MRSVTHHSVKPPRLTARLALALLVGCSLLAAPAAVPVRAQSCQQGGSPLCSGCWASYNIAWDPQFEQADCLAWRYGPGTEWVESGRLCGTWLESFGHSGRFDGPSADWLVIHQTTNALDQPGRDHFWVGYTYKIDDPLNNPDTQLQVWLRVLEGSYWNWYFVDAGPGGAQSCQFREVDLGHHPEWVGRQVVIYFTAYLPGDSNITIDNVSLWQSYAQ